MFGNIYEIKNNGNGLITGDDGKTYFFKKTDLSNAAIAQIEEGDQVEFLTTDSFEGAKYERAIKVRKTSTRGGSTVSTVHPGIHPFAQMSLLNDDEQKIVDFLSKEFYVTKIGAPFSMGNSTFRYCLIKPTQYYSTTFHLSREMVVVFSDYVEFEPRSLDAFSSVLTRIESKLRLERCGHVFICNDSNVEEKLLELLRDTNLNSIIIPFSYYEFLRGDMTCDKIQRRFQKYLFEADLFSETRPIENDVFFFGRRDYAQDIANKCKNNKYSGVFGLRRSGKTSLLYAVRRLLTQEGYESVYVPCNSELAALDWNTALYQLVKDMQEVEGKKAHLHSIQEYCDNPNMAVTFFQDDVNIVLGSLSKPFTIMFDEIEYITFNSTKGSDSWKNGEGFIKFWNALRGYGLKYPNKLSIVIAGTNPLINEKPSIEINGEQKENPMFGQLSESNQGAYLLPFNIKSTATMVNTLGGFMGLKFKDTVCAKLTSDCGGHPYLIRLLCKSINQYVKSKGTARPTEISEGIYNTVRPSFEKSNEAQSFYTMILLILQENFIEEYNTLKYLAIQKGYGEVLSETQNRDSLMHLLGYGLLDQNEGTYAIKFDVIRRFFQGKFRFEVVGLSDAEKRQEINLRYNEAEIKLRKMIKQTLQIVNCAC